MRRTVASRFVILLLICAAVLALPGGLLAADGQGAGCHCRHAGPGLSSGCCCCLPGTSGPCGNAAQAGGSACRCGASLPAIISPTADTAPSWQATTHMPIMVGVSSKALPPNIFHPPELQTVFAQL